MKSTSNNNQNKKTELLSNELDKLLSDKYILAKEIRDLNRTLQESVETLNNLEDEVKNRLSLKEQLEQCINQVNEIQTGTELPASINTLMNELIEKFNEEHVPGRLSETIKTEKSNYKQIKQLILENILALSDDINNLREKIECRDNVNSEVSAERDHMKFQLKNIEEEIADYKRREVEEK